MEIPKSAEAGTLESGDGTILDVVHKTNPLEL